MQPTNVTYGECSLPFEKRPKSGPTSAQYGGFTFLQWKRVKVHRPSFTVYSPHECKGVRGKNDIIVEWAAMRIECVSLFFMWHSHMLSNGVYFERLRIRLYAHVSLHVKSEVYYTAHFYTQKISSHRDVLCVGSSLEKIIWMLPT